MTDNMTKTAMTAPVNRLQTVQIDSGTTFGLRELARIRADRLMIALLLIVTGATGAIDAVSILHFQAFAAFVTGTVVLLGAEMGGQAHAGVAKWLSHEEPEAGNLHIRVCSSSEPSSEDA